MSRYDRHDDRDRRDGRDRFDDRDRRYDDRRYDTRPRYDDERDRYDDRRRYDDGRDRYDDRRDRYDDRRFPGPGYGGSSRGGGGLPLDKHEEGGGGADKFSVRVFVGGLNNRTNERDVVAAFSKCGRIREIAMKKGFCFVEFKDNYEALAAVRRLNGAEINGARVRVQHSRARPGEGKCFHCGKDGHWARECPDGDMSDKCYHCGDSGHLRRDCKSKGGRRRRSRSPGTGSKGGRSRSKSRSPVQEVAKNGDVAVDVEGLSEDIELVEIPKEDKPETAGEVSGTPENKEVPPEEKPSE